MKTQIELKEFAKSSDLSLRDLAKAEHGGSRSDVFNINPYSLHVREGWNVREDNAAYQDRINDLALSISKHGVLQPLCVFKDPGDGKYYIVSGHTRYLAVQRCAELYSVVIQSVPVMLTPKGSNDLDRLAMQVTYNDAQTLSALELSKLFKVMLAAGASAEDIAEKCGKSITYVKKTIALGEVPEEVKRMVSDGKVSPTLAAQVYKEHGSAAPDVLKAAEKEVTSKKKGITAEAVKKVAPPKPKMAATKKTDEMKVIHESPVARKTEVDHSLKSNASKIKTIILDADIKQSGDVYQLEINSAAYEVLMNLLNSI